MSTMMFEHNDASQLGLRGRSLSPTRGPSHSPARRRAPSPLRNAQFRPIAMSYAASPTTSESCQYFNASYKEEDPVGAPGGFCANVRTVGYSTVGGKTFMSGKCPHCKQIVKSDKQVCTPNASPSPSPWKLQSPLRSPIRGSRSSDGHVALQSPLRSPFKGPFFKGQSKDVDREETSSNKTDSTDEAENVDSNKPANNPSERPSGRRPRGRSQDSRSVLKSPRGRSPLANLSSRTPWRGRTLSARSSSPVRTCTSGRSTRGPRSPRPHSPMNSPWKGASFFEGAGADVQTECINPMSRGKSRGAHSPGPRNPINPDGPLRVKVDFVSPYGEDELREAEERVAAKKQQAEGGWKSPLLSPFKGRLFGRGEKAAPLGSE